jgi:hypothetical protein
MSGEMQFADYVVSYALQSLSRELRRVSESGGDLQCTDEKAVRVTAERLLSIWQMMQWSVGKLQYQRAQADLRDLASLCHQPSIESQAATRLLEKADDKSRKLLTALVGRLPVAPTVDFSRDRLSALLQSESARWRDYSLLRQISESDLIEHGMLRAFKKGMELNLKLDRIADAEDGPSVKRLSRAGRWARHTVNQLELIRPALSESGRTRRWHLNRLAAKLEDQMALECFVRTVESLELKPKDWRRLRPLVQRQRQRLDKQRRKLTVGAFAGGVKGYRLDAEAAVKLLGLKEITLLPVDGSGSDRRNLHGLGENRR